MPEGRVVQRFITCVVCGIGNERRMNIKEASECATVVRKESIRWKIEGF